MLEFIDYSSRRGAIVNLLPQVHGLLKELSANDKLCGLEAPEGIVGWRQKMNPLLLDITRRFVFAVDTAKNRKLVGFLFYRHGEAGKLYIEDMQVAFGERGEMVSAGMLAKLEYDAKAREAAFFGSERLRKMQDKEILAGVGFVEHFANGYELLGDIKEASGALKLRYGKAKA
ncbi:MAG: hypothetical protein FWC16_08155 [Defluviitaleaceae bacterium]|nr:hypothetical protein [Defluviitaleaceae bacterium]MCL2274885.1 hypothetical protein [Defluviitaleaceae bacterium]